MAAVVLAGGSGTRMGADTNKVYLPIGGRPVLEVAVAALVASQLVVHLVVVVRDGDQRAAHEALGPHRPVVDAVVVGGANRAESEWRGLVASGLDVPDGPAPELVAVCDGARPFLTHGLLAELVAVARRRGGAVPGVDVVETLLDVRDPARAQPVEGRRLVRVQTPQVMRSAELVAAHRRAGADRATALDTAEIIERWGIGDTEVGVVRADDRNVKVTTPADLTAASAAMAGWHDGRWA